MLFTTTFVTAKDVAKTNDFTPIANASTTMMAADSDTLLTPHERELNRKIANYERRLEKRDRFYRSLIPDFLRLQYAGSIGLINLGVGWEHDQKKHFETDIMFGYVPRYNKESHFYTVTLRETYVPWTKPLYKNVITFQPLSCGVFVNSVLNSDYWTREPDRYPNADYYRFSSKIRFHIFIGQRYSFNIPEEKRFISRQVSLVWELSTCDLYVISKAVNKTLPWYETLSLSLGLKYNF